MLDATPLPPCCAATVRAVADQREDTTCDCGETYRWSGAVADARVQVADEDTLRPSTVPPVARLTHVEDDELVRVRRLLTELRPDRDGPLGWAADGSPPASAGSNWTPALRVQTSAEVPAILPGAFASTAPASRAPDLDRGFPGMPDDIRATLRWCQRHGTLKDGLRALYVGCALAASVSTAEAREAWKVLPEKDRQPARVLYGRKRVLAAMAAWWGEVDTGAVVGSNAAIGTPLAAVDVRPLPADAADPAQSERPITSPA